MKNLHLTTGLGMLLLFVLSGLYLKFTLPPFAGELDGSRMMYRASHVYLMLSAAVNVMTGIYYRAFADLLAVWLQRIGSLLVVLSQTILLAAFVIEPAQHLISRDYTLAGCVSLLLGVFLVFCGWLYQLRRGKKSC